MCSSPGVDKVQVRRGSTRRRLRRRRLRKRAQASRHLHDRLPVAQDDSVGHDGHIVALDQGPFFQACTRDDLCLQARRKLRSLEEETGWMHHHGEGKLLEGSFERVNDPHGIVVACAQPLLEVRPPPRVQGAHAGGPSGVRVTAGIGMYSDLRLPTQVALHLAVWVHAEVDRAGKARGADAEDHGADGLDRRAAGHANDDPSHDHVCMQPCRGRLHVTFEPTPRVVLL
mmetsp:Transcript_29161/g.74082  ORF Transcript_29161/g.74082 Transcript_29161/m.74082 type:complete len:228 (+) Transcript_29161:1517-2200(+)